MALNMESLFAMWSYAKKTHNVPNAMRFAFNHEFSSKNDDFHFEPKQNQSYHKSNKSCLLMQKIMRAIFIYTATKISARLLVKNANSIESSCTL